MLIESKGEYPKGVIEVDVCIVGAGPSGTTLALELLKSGIRVCLLESGGHRQEPGPADLNVAAVESQHGYRSQTLVDGRRRQVGGAAHLWNHSMRGEPGKFVRLVPLDEIDFECRDWVPLSGWPFSRRELLPYYAQAHAVCGVGPFGRPVESWRRQANAEEVWQSKTMESLVCHFGNAQVFLKDHKAALKKAPRAFLFENSSLVALKPDLKTPNVISSAEVARADGRRFIVKAEHFVLATGGVENARILLLNESTRHGGPGNQHDMVGRCFMDHPSIILGTLAPSSPQVYDRAAFYDQRTVDGFAVMGILHLRNGVMRQEKILNACVSLVPHFRDLSSNIGPVLRQIAAKGPLYLRRRLGVTRTVVSSGPAADPNTTMRRRLLEGYYAERLTGWSRLRNKERRFGEIGVRSLIEQSPDPSNRVALGDEIDALGQRRCKIFWRWNELDLASIRRTQAIFGREFAAAGVGNFTPEPEDPGNIPRSFFSPHHFMGTTRMHEDPRHGVVDAHCRVHGLKNLHIAGSSVFPTGGFANPTLTILAMTLRLAARLGEVISSTPDLRSKAVAASVV